ncbi:hypothetical protein [Streptomyces sp. MST-110588]
MPALYGTTWPLAWRCPPTPDGHLVHALLLWNTLNVLVEEEGP